MPQFLDSSEGNSNFQLIEKLWLSKTRSNRPFHRICTLMRKLDSQSVIIENIDPGHDIVLKETTALNTYHENKIIYTIYRISFFNEKIKDDDELKTKRKDINLLSSIILINYKHEDKFINTYIYSSVICTPFMKTPNGENVNLLNNYTSSSRKFTCSINCANEYFDFVIYGTYFVQQNTFTSVCAHACLCMTINNMKESSDPIISPEDINIVLGYDHKKNKVQGGLTKDEMVAFIENKGLAVDQNAFIEGFPNSNFSEYSYRYMESKCPSMLIFTTSSNAAHVVPIIGHTLNTDLWRPEAELAYSSQFGGTKYRTAAAWVDHFIIHDDNFGPNYCLPVDALSPYPNLNIPTKKRKRIKKKAEKKAKKNIDLSFKAICALSVISKDIKALASKSEWASIALLEHFTKQLAAFSGDKEYWLEMLIKSVLGTTSHPFVARTLLVSKDFYMQGLNETNFKKESFSVGDKKFLTDKLPNKFWLTEITLPDIYTANKSKLADIIYRSDKPIAQEEDIGKNWILTRLPGIIIRKNHSDGAPIELQKCDITWHYPLLRPMSSKRHFEW